MLVIQTQFLVQNSIERKLHLKEIRGIKVFKEKRVIKVSVEKWDLLDQKASLVSKVPKEKVVMGICPLVKEFL